MAGSSTDRNSKLTRWPRAPAVPVVLATAVGILVDHQLDLTLPQWAGVAAAAVVAVVLSGAFRSGKHRRAGWASAVGALILWGCIGGWRHHAVWSLRGEHNITTFLALPRAPARLVARIETALAIDEADHSTSAPRWTQVDRTLAIVRCESIGDSAHAQPVEGLVRMEVTGHLIGPRVGDRLEMFGQLQQPSGPRNPGGFDYAAWLRSAGIDATFRVEHPDHVRVIESNYGWLDRLSQWRDRVRREVEWLCIQRLDYSEVPLATSLLLGDRTGLDPQVADQFAASGTMHLLAISGLHVGILAGLVHLVCRLLNCGPRTTIAVMLCVVVGYAIITDQRPPVMRAALLATIVLAGRAAGRDAGGYHALALCALAILWYRPTDLFDPGAQLSFIAVLAILWSSRWNRQRELQQDLLREPEADSAPRRAWAGARLFLRQAYVMTGTIWLFTLPLTAWHFHLCSPVGLLINVVLVPVTAMMLTAGYGMVLLGLAHPLLALPPAMLFSLLLGLLLKAVDISATTPLGHLFVPAPHGAWLAGFYLLLAVATQFIPIRWSPGLVWRSLAVWCMGGLLMGLYPTRPDGLRVTFLSVGHGCSVVIETPNGRTLLYDAGSFVDGRRAERAITAVLWDRGHTRVDAAIVSHADVDHFNGLPGLVAKMPVGSILLAPSSLDFQQEAVVDLCEAASQTGVPIRCIQAGDVLSIDPEVNCEILHPAGGFRAAEDNANSVVLRVTYRNRSLLLTGDLEGPGLDCLLQLEPRPVDVLMAPHHGSRAASPSALGVWASPHTVIASSADEDPVVDLRDRYPEDIPILTTAAAGAIEVAISPDGELRVTPFLP